MIRRSLSLNVVEIHLFLFQSAPPTGVRGDSGRWGDLQCPGEVSIRSPHRSEGRPDAVMNHKLSSKFQSAPPTGVRGDHAGLEKVGVLVNSFNPLPPPE